MFHERIKKKSWKYFRLLNCVIYTIIDNLVCIDFLAYQSKQLSEINVNGKYLVKYFNKLLCIGIPDLLMNLLSCHGSIKNKNIIVILKYHKSMLEYYFSKGFGIFNAIQII